MENTHHGKMVSKMGRLKHFFLQNIQRFPIYIGVILITFLVKEIYPFSFYPMYNNFPNWSYTFFFEDENRKNLKEFLPISHGALSHLYYTECDKQKIEHGNGLESTEDLEIIGKNITQQAIDFKSLQATSIRQVKLRRIYNYIEKNEMKSDTITMSTVYVK